MGIIATKVADGLLEPPPKLGKLDRIIAALDDDEDRAIVADWLHDESLTAQAVADKLSSCGYSIGEKAVRQWRRVNVA